VVPAVHVTLGGKPEDHRSFQPKVSLAELTEIPGVGTEMRVILSSRAVSCDSYASLTPDQLLVVLNFTAPGNLDTGSYPWQGSKPESEGTHDTPPPPPPAQVMPVIRLGKQLVELPPGGTVELTELRLDAQGAVRGVLHLEQPGSAGLPATALLGSFSARWCRIATAASVETP
jgi:hypothetical protein